MTDLAVSPGADALRAAMVDRVATDPAVTRWIPTLRPWLDALGHVPRHLFIPAKVYVPNVDGARPPLVGLHRDDDPARWLSIAYGGEPPGWVVTQVDDGQPAESDGGVEPTSSASAPLIIAIMLAALDAQCGERVLEIGTGSGYNAALLAHRLGAGCVTSVEVDPVVADTARLRLRANSSGVHVVRGDGADGCPQGAPYDRVIATVGVREIPHAWIAQTRPGGRVLFPYRNTFTGALVASTVVDDGHATGSIVDNASFMWLRGQRPPRRRRARRRPARRRSRHDRHPSVLARWRRPWRAVRNRSAGAAMPVAVPRRAR